MKVVNKMKKHKIKPQYNIGDLFEITPLSTSQPSLYILVEEDEGYILRQVKDGNWLGANGHHPTPEDLIVNLKQLIKSDGIERYPTHSYELHIKERRNSNE